MDLAPYVFICDLHVAKNRLWKDRCIKWNFWRDANGEIILNFL